MAERLASGWTGPPVEVAVESNCRKNTVARTSLGRGTGFGGSTVTTRKRGSLRIASSQARLRARTSADQGAFQRPRMPKSGTTSDHALPGLDSVEQRREVVAKRRRLQALGAVAPVGDAEVVERADERRPAQAVERGGGSSAGRAPARAGWR